MLKSIGAQYIVIGPSERRCSTTKV
ncbi:hypothetical protein ACNKHW_25075 [Shigella flexneri]